MSQEQGPEINRYLYQQIYSELKDEILSGAFKKGDWFPPERVLKERFATTHLTVRNALAKLVLEGYIERYSGKGTVVIYAREGSSAPRRKLLFPFAHVILEDIGEASARLLEALERQFRTVPLPVRISCHHGDVLLSNALLDEAEETGALVVAMPAGGAGRIALTIRGAGLAGIEVSVDAAAGARRAARYLLDRGHTERALLSASALEGPLRDGFLEDPHGSGAAPGSVSTHSCSPGLDGGAAAATELLARRPGCRGFFCASDETAAGLVRGLQEAGLRVGRDFSVVGWGNSKLANALLLTSVDPGYDRLAQKAVAVATEAMSQGKLPQQPFSIQPEILVRAS